MKKYGIGNYINFLFKVDYCSAKLCLMMALCGVLEDERGHCLFLKEVIRYIWQLLCYKD